MEKCCSLPDNIIFDRFFFLSKNAITEIHLHVFLEYINLGKNTSSEFKHVFHGGFFTYHLFAICYIVVEYQTLYFLYIKSPILWILWCITGLQCNLGKNNRWYLFKHFMVLILIPAILLYIILGHSRRDDHL